MEQELIKGSPAEIFYRLVKNQRNDIKSDGRYGRMHFEDIMRIHIFMNDVDIFTDKCVVFKHPDDKKHNKNYISVSYNSKKVSLLRLLHLNYVKDVNSKQEITYLCPNAGLCMTLSHCAFN